MASTDIPPQTPEDRTLEMAAMRLLRSRDEDGHNGREPSPREGPDYRRAHDAVARAWDAVGEMGSTPEMIALRRAALYNASHAGKIHARRWFASEGMARWIGAAAVLLVVITSVAAYIWSHPLWPQIYETSVGERRVVTLADNSKIALDEDSRVAVRYSPRFRDLQLLKGQAEFDVAHDQSRPFSVSAGGRRVVATGTLFNVDLLGNRLFVTLLRGRVVVAKDNADSAAGAIPLKPSERLTVERATGSVQKTSVDTADVEAWKLGKLVFEVEPLDQAVARVNRYALRKITLAAASQARQPVSGVFNAGDADAFADAVSAQLQVRAELRGGAIVLIPR